MTTAAAPVISLQLNGQPVELRAHPMDRLSQALRDNGWSDTKVGCDAGDCGACSVLLDDEVVCSCLVPAAQAQGGRVQTAAGLNESDLPGT